MTAEIKMEWINDPIVMFDGEKAYGSKRLKTTVNDIRETIIGPIDFGHVHYGDEMPRRGDTVIFDVTTYPKWWQFWKKPQTEPKPFTITETWPS